MSFHNIYKGKKVFLTGHTGFKGAWLSLWLSELGAEVMGYALKPHTAPSLFEILGNEKRLIHHVGDVRSYEGLYGVINDFRPEVVFHLAAQAITKLSYDIPHETFETNTIGTLNILECIRLVNSIKAAVIVTSDKCYENVEWLWGYRENDRLGGKDPYSASKACAELISHSYMRSFFDVPAVATARAGNVIGGGDWAYERIVPDFVHAIDKGATLEIRSPNATRPWQHVLEPLSGYLWLGANLLLKKENISGQSFNFGPGGQADKTVQELIDSFIKAIGNGQYILHPLDPDNKKEATLLKLNCDKALHHLAWRPVLDFDETVDFSAMWYRHFYDKQTDMLTLTSNQISHYTSLAHQRGLSWTD
ncbi:MAG: CDP-glucose 4,6-dehydratase [Nitrospirae bacterium]|nr:CDP-glucose 4,6-dehydratase [Nitrospirota bacterium]MBF0554106.1 CDP-glucose 4,6-dehydratase [Nitrospirota bacterium]